MPSRGDSREWESYLRFWEGNPHWRKPRLGKIDNDSWQLFNEVIVSLHSQPSKAAAPGNSSDGKEYEWYDDEVKGYFRIRRLSKEELKNMQPVHKLPSIKGDERFKMVVAPPSNGSGFSAGRCQIGSRCFLNMTSPSVWGIPERVHERETLEYVTKQNPSFKVPEALWYFHGEEPEPDAGFQYDYLLVKAIPGGRTLTSTFMEQRPREQRRALQRQIVDAVEEMARWKPSGDLMPGWKGPFIAGANGKELPIIFSGPLQACIDVRKQRRELANGDLAAVFKELGIDPAETVFCNANLMASPQIVVDDDLRLIGFNDWSQCGFIPKGWVNPLYILNEPSLHPHSEVYPTDQSTTSLHAKAAERLAAVSLSDDLSSRGFPHNADQLLKLLEKLDEAIVKRSRYVSYNRSVSYLTAPHYCNEEYRPVLYRQPQEERVFKEKARLENSRARAAQKAKEDQKS